MNVALESKYYLFNPGAKTITFQNYHIREQDIVTITNLTTNDLIYNFTCSDEGGIFENNVLTLAYDTTTMNATDNLLVVVVVESKEVSLLQKLVEEVSDLSLLLKPISSVNSEDSILGDIIVSKLETLSPFKYDSRNITTATTTVVLRGRGILKRIVFNSPTNNLVVIYDNIVAFGKKIATIDPSATTDPFYIDYDVEFFTGLTVVTEGTPDLTVISRRATDIN